MYWRLVHLVDEDLLLLLQREEVAALALAIEDQFDRNIRSPRTRELWLGEDGGGALPMAGRALAQPISLSASEERRARYVLRGALHEIDSRSDRGFRQLAFEMLIRTWSSALLLLFSMMGLILALGHGVPPYFPMKIPLSDPDFLFIISALAGAAGATVANMIANRELAVASGPTRRYFLYYILGRPILGAFAGVVLFLLIQSQLLIAVVPYGAEMAANGAAEAVADGASPGVVTFHASQSAYPHLFAILALAAGFSAEWFLGNVMDKVLTRIIQRAEKSKNSPEEEAGASKVSSGARSAG
jgi:hypothetical protein